MLYCPKCQQTYDEGSQRFCNNDGGRLQPVSNAEKSADKPGGVFTNLLSRNVPNKERDEKLAAIPRFVRAEPEPEPIPQYEPPQVPAAPAAKDTYAFESDPDEIELELDPVEAPRQEPVFFIPTPEPEKTPEPEVPAPIAEEAPAAPPVFESSVAPFDPEKPIGRVVRPEDIPSGRAELGDRQFNPAGREALTWDTPEVMIGQTVKGRYKITDLSGEDDAGFSYLAEDKIVAGKKVVVRVVMDEGDIPEESEQMYLDERVSFSHIVHPNVAGIIDSGELQEGKSFVISEYVEGNSVKSLLETSGQFNVLRTARMVRQSAYALSEMHQNRVVHRNLTPSNIILTLSDSDTEQVKITGFGMPGSSSRKNLVYNAPEVLDGKPAAAASDIYSLAVIAYQMLTNRVPFSGDSAKQMLRSQREGMLLSPTNLRLDVSPLVDQILGKGMALVPGDRYPKARDFGDALFNALTTVAPWTNEQEKEEKVELLSSETPAIVPMPPAPEFLDEETPELEEVAAPVEDAPAEEAPVVPVMDKENVQVLEPLAVAATEPAPAAEDGPAWTKRSPEPPKTGSANWALFSIIGFAALLIGIWAIWAYFLRQPNAPAYVPKDTTAQNSYNGPPITPTTESNNRPATENGDVPPERRQIEQPPNTTFFQTSRQSLKGDLARNFVDFSLYYPNDWKVNQGEAATERGMRGKFLDISRDAPNGLLAEQMLVSYYESHGTYSADEVKFAGLVEETNKTLKGIIKDYQMLSKGRITVNGGWPAYEVKFQGGGTTDKGEKVIVWGRRLFVPAARPGVKNGFEITMIATSASPDVKSVDDVGNKGGLATVLNTFEPGKNF